MKKHSALLVAALAAALGVGGALPAAAATATQTRISGAGAATPAALRLMPLGDSITWGYASPTGNGYRGYLYNDLAAEGHSVDFVGSVRNGTMSDPDNEGHSGWRIDQIAGIADSVLATYQPNVVTLEIGTNDLNGNYQVSTATDRLKSLIDQIARDVPNATVLVGTLIVSTSGTEEASRPGFNAKLPAIVQGEQAAGKHVSLVDMSALTTADLADSLHPNDNGYRKMADAFNAAVQTADAAGWIKPPGSGGGQVRSGIAGKCLDIGGGNSANGTAADIWTCNGSAGQTWSARSDGTLQALGKCLDATARGTANGTKIELWDCNGGANQQWQSYNGGYRNPVSGRCLDDPNLSATDGTQLVLWDCNGGANQQWTALPIS
ncbi:SGNH/GDSL hydrolase family protein [Actinacidiphila acididurans]|uniref:Ricin-type beta-trefoil lectin domain protein n=1 Tax=Actinacidiphila acididurans TaxID=2784346 RepID=A0ABS2TI21_9ACTN|nr:SGNH/GDSL hydrolase family protein [Actinacidiphila acididurans]MBM9502995.1 ricin-type beta-trefoil lectin domain protein [Actinacidiphila acididurans]